MTETYGNYVGGEWTESESGETFEVRNPAEKDEVVARFQSSTTADTEDAIQTAVDAQDEWANTPGPERGAVLNRTAKNLEARKEETTEALVNEEGKTYSEASGEVQRAIDIFYYYAQKARDLGGTVKSPSAPNKELYTKREPLGTVGLITPWNYPIAIPSWKLAPALATGNTVVIKPASAAPNVVRIVFECLEEAGLPDGAANFVTGSGSQVGGPLAGHEDIDGVSFTGSTVVGTSVAQTAAEDLTRVQAEMGGKNPTVVMPSADVEEAAEILGTGAFGTTGQSCTAASRAVVHEDIYDEFVEAMADYADSVDIGPGMDDPDMGPHVTESELEGTLDYIEVAENEGAKLVAGGGVPEGEAYENGYYVEPTVFADVESDMRIAQEEVFGPVLAVIPVEDFDEGLEVANDVDFGLSASVVTDDLSEANTFLDEVESGVAKVNEKTTGLEYHVPFGGFKDSSSETWREQGDEGLEFYTVSRTFYVNY